MPTHLKKGRYKGVAKLHPRSLWLQTAGRFRGMCKQKNFITEKLLTYVPQLPLLCLNTNFKMYHENYLMDF